MIRRPPVPPTPSPGATATRVPVQRGAAATGRHRHPGRARIGGPQLAERVCLGLALLGSVAAVVLSLQGQRVAAVAVAALGLVLAVSGLVLGWRSANLRRGTGSPGR